MEPGRAGAAAAEGGGRPLDDVGLRLQAVLDNATVSIFLMDDRQHCIYMNRAAEALTGFTMAEVVALDRPLHDIIHHSHPDGTPFPLADCAIDRAFPEHAQSSGEEMFVHRDGSFYPVAFTASPIRDEARQTIGTIIEVRDIRAERESAAHQQMLLNELNHRVKNTLATIQAIAWQTFGSREAEAVDLFEGRLRALASAHDMLTREGWDAVSLTEVVKAAVLPFGTERMAFHGPDVLVSAKMATTLAIALHELGTNATKYGALSNGQGCVGLQWQVAEGGELLLSWEEAGGPPVLAPARRGFGSRLIERQLGPEFGGSARLELQPQGVRCHMRLGRANWMRRKGQG